MVILFTATNQGQSTLASRIVQQQMSTAGSWKQPTSCGAQQTQTRQCCAVAAGAAMVHVQLYELVPVGHRTVRTSVNRGTPGYELELPLRFLQK
jgi:hypothetical protein